MLALLYLLHSRSRTHGSTCYEISAKFANKKPRDIARGFVLIEETRQPTSCALPSLCVLRYFPNGLLLPLASSTKHREQPSPPPNNHTAPGIGVPGGLSSHNAGSVQFGLMIGVPATIARNVSGPSFNSWHYAEVLTPVPQPSLANKPTWSNSRCAGV